MGDGKAAESSAIGARGKAVISLTPDVDGTGSVPCWMQFCLPFCIFDPVMSWK